MSFTLRVFDGTDRMAIGPFAGVKELLTLGGPQLTPFISDSESDFFFFELWDSAGRLLTVEIRKDVPFDEIMKRLNVFNPAFYNPGSEQ